MLLHALEPLSVPGNSPVVEVPADYYPAGGGFSFTIGKGPDAGKKMFVRDSVHGAGDPRATIVLVHGNPESSYTFRHVNSALSARAGRAFRIVAADHIGFGLSDTAATEMLCMDHAANLLRLIRYLDLDRVTLVIHDWGGPIGIGAFLPEHERVANLVILNSTVFPMPEEGMTYRNFPICWLPWSRAPAVIPDRYWGSFAAYAIFRTRARPAEIVMQMLRYIHRAESGRFPEKEHTAHELYRQQFQSKANVKSSKNLVRQSAVWGHGNRVSGSIRGMRDTTPFYRNIQETIREKWGPGGENIRARAVLGGWDPLAKDEVVAQWIEHLPQLYGHVKRFEQAGHFVEETHPGEVAEAIADVAGLQ